MCAENVRLSNAYEARFDELLARVSTWSPRGRRVTDLVACWTAVGSRYVPGAGLFVVGRATNGYPNEFNPLTLGDPTARAEVLGKARAFAERPDDREPLYWVTARNTVETPLAPGKKRRVGGTIASRSAFWRVTKALRATIDPTPMADDWASDVAWGNLYKLAPTFAKDVMSEGANPISSLQDLQRAPCIELLRQEVAESNPRVVLVIAGRDWYQPFADGLGLSLVERGGARHVRDVAIDSEGRKWIFTNRPECQSQTAFVGELTHAWGELAIPPLV